MTLPSGTERPPFSAARIAAVLDLPPPTEQQSAIIEHPPLPLLVVAGAGSGKTETMSARVVWLVANGHVAPDQVLGLTFTRKAAAELAARISARLRALADAGLWRPSADAPDLVAAPPTVSTYHAYAGRLVREHALRLGREPDARLLSEAAAWQLAHEVVTAYDGPLEELGKAESTITNAVVDLSAEMAEHLVSPEHLAHWLDAVEARLSATAESGGPPRAGTRDMRATLRAKRALVPVLQRYAEVKRARGALDFADQMALAARLATSMPEVGRVERQRFGAVLLDEFQDTSHAQLELLTAVFAPTGHAHNVTAVGDPHQSIYAWRGASAATLARFPDAFGAQETPVRALSQTWRNAERILQAANSVAAPLRDTCAVPVEPLAARPGAGPGVLDAARTSTALDEARLVAQWIAGQRAGGAVSAAVLCRKRSQFPEIVAALESLGLPVEVVGLGGLLSTPEVQDLVALLWVAHDAARGDRLMRLLTGPPCRLGVADLDRFHRWARDRQRPPDASGGGSRGGERSDPVERVSLIEALADFAAAGPGERRATGLSAPARRRLLELSTAVSDVRGVTGAGLPDLVAEAERALGLDIEVLSRPGYAPSVARAHLDAFADVAADFHQSSDRPTLGGFLAWLDAALEEERGLDRGVLDITPDAVHVLTVHAAKGLEWDAVAVPGLVEAGFPAHGATTSRHDAAGGRWVCGRPSEGAWTVGLDGLPYDLRGDASVLATFPWRSAADAAAWESARVTFREAAGDAALAEERRLAYVALTRAREALLLTCPVWATQKTPRVPSRFVRELLDTRPDLLNILEWADDPAPDAKNPLLATPVSVSWPEDRAPQDLLRIGAAHVEDALGHTDGERFAMPREVEVLLAERRARRAGAGTFAAQAAPGGGWRVLDALGGHLSTSQLVAYAAAPDDFARDIRRPMPTRPSTATRRGTAFHSWLERHYRRAALLEPADLPGSSDTSAPDGTDLEELTSRFLRSEWADREPLEVEVLVESVVAGAAVRGRIDAVFADPGGGWVIVDWKSGRPPSGAAAHAAAVQLASYRTAYARLRGVDPASVRAAFYYAATGESVFPPLRSEADLEALVATLHS